MDKTEKIAVFSTIGLLVIGGIVTTVIVLKKKDSDSFNEKLGDVDSVAKQWHQFDWAGGEDNGATTGLHILGGNGGFSVGDTVEIQANGNIPNLNGVHTIVGLKADDGTYPNMIRVNVPKPSGTSAKGKVRKV